MKKNLMDGMTYVKFIRYLLYPLTLLLTTPFLITASLWHSLKILRSNPRHYPHLDLLSGLNSLFYWTRALNIKRYGLTGTSPFLGLGNARLSRLFHYTNFSLVTYCNAGGLTVFFGMFGWWAFHLIWLNELTYTWVLIVAGLTLISSTFYIMLFKGQNYNVIGWMFFPVVLYGAATNNWILVSIAWFAISFGSFTLTFIGGILSFALALYSFSFLPILAYIPAGLKLLMHSYPLLKGEGSGTELTSLMKALGITDRNVKYKRKSRKKFGVVQLYRLLLYVQFMSLQFYLCGDFSILFATGVLLFIINSVKIRFADEETIFMLMMSIATAITINCDETLMLLPYWILISPLPQLAGLHNFKGVVDILPVMKPISTQPYMQSMYEFFSPIKTNSTVLMAYNDPQDTYENIFDGYRQLTELPLYVANVKKIHLLPDWLAVFELNYQGAPEIWGKDVESVVRNMQHWRADYVIIYQDDNEVIDPKWVEAGFEVMGSYEWSQFKDDFEKYKKINIENLRWWLVKYNG